MAFQRFRQMIEESIAQQKGKHLLHGEIESDAAALLFDSARSSIKAGREIFRNAFTNYSSIEERMWLRGAIISWGDHEVMPFRESEILDCKEGKLLNNTYTHSLLRAISVEKSGFKGMRLVIEKYPSRKMISRQSRFIKIHEVVVPIAMRLGSSAYPAAIDNYMDILWMASETEDEWEEYKITMNGRLVSSARNAEEFIHAAATQVVFSECGGFANSVYNTKAENKNA